MFISDIDSPGTTDLTSETETSPVGQEWDPTSMKTLIIPFAEINAACFGSEYLNKSLSLSSTEKASDSSVLRYNGDNSTVRAYTEERIRTGACLIFFS